MTRKNPAIARLRREARQAEEMSSQYAREAQQLRRHANMLEREDERAKEDARQALARAEKREGRDG